MGEYFMTNHEEPKYSSEYDKKQFIEICDRYEDKILENIIKKAKEMGAHIALLPEMWSCGYDICRRPFEEWKKEGVPADSSFVRTFGGAGQRAFHGNRHYLP